MIIRKIFRTAGLLLLGFVLFVVLYFAAAVGLSGISTDGEEGQPGEVTVYLLTNGVHTDLVVPVRTGETDWSRDILFDNTTSKDSGAQFVAFGWGDKGFYLQTPTWADLTFGVAFRAACGLSTSAIHATFYNELSEDGSCKKIRISNAQYQRLVTYIRQSFAFDEQGRPVCIKTGACYGEHDAFYEANGSYSIFHTCNTWANNGLKASGQRACLWTPFDKGMFRLYP